MSGVTHSGVGPLIAGLKSPIADFQLHIANAIWCKRASISRRSLKICCQRNMAALASILILPIRPAASGRINAWVSEQTSGKIQDLFSPGSSSAKHGAGSDQCDLFQARIGSRRFCRDRSALGDFHVPNQADPAQRMMMHEHGSFPIMRGDEFDALELPYKGGKMGMLIVLPKSNDGLKAVESKAVGRFFESCCRGA